MAGQNEKKGQRERVSILKSGKMTTSDNQSRSVTIRGVSGASQTVSVTRPQKKPWVSDDVIARDAATGKEGDLVGQGFAEQGES